MLGSHSTSQTPLGFLATLGDIIGLVASPRSTPSTAARRQTAVRATAATETVAKHLF